MIFKCEIDMDNDAFAHDPHLELYRVIKKIANEVNQFVCDERHKAIWDYNGNKIGSWTIKV